MEKDIVIGISDMKISQKPGRLVTYALGSCVGICIHDNKKKNKWFIAYFTARG